MHTLPASLILTSLLFTVLGCAVVDPDIAATRGERFLGKVTEDAARHRGGERAISERPRPWIDWRNYWATGDADSKVPGFGALFGDLGGNGRGIRGALLDLEFQRMEM